MKFWFWKKKKGEDETSEGQKERPVRVQSARIKNPLVQSDPEAEGKGASAPPGAPQRPITATTKVRVMPQYVPQEVPAKPIITEVRTVVIAYGFAKIIEDGDQNFIISSGIPPNVRIVPYVGGDVVYGAYIIDAEKSKKIGAKNVIAPILDLIPYILLDDEHRAEMQRDLKTAGLSYKTPAERDLTSELKSALGKSQVLWRHQAEKSVELKNFVDDILSIKDSDQFKNIYLIKARGNRRYIMAVDQLIETVIDLHPQFLKIYQPEAFRISFNGSENTWIAPLYMG